MPHIADRQVLLGVVLLQVLGQLLSLALFARTRNLALLVVISFTLGLLLVFTGVPALGGLALSAGSAVWGILAPLGAILLLGARAGWPAYVALVVVIVAGALIDPLIPEGLALPHDAAVAIGVYNVIGPALICTLLVFYIDGQRLAARRQSDALLLNVLPEPIADRLKSGERVIADHYDQASVLFADIVNFTPLSESKAPAEVVSGPERSLHRFRPLGR